MKKILYLFVSVLIFLIIGGCGFMEKNVADMDPRDLPNVTAFQNNFTREFMASIEPVEEGYYEFESKTGGYTMNFPENALMSKGFYERKKDTFERFSFGEEINQENSNIPYYVIATYDNFHKEKDSSRLLNLLSRAVNFEGEYEEFTHENHTIFFATSESTTRNEETTWYEFFGTVISNKSNQSLEYIYSVKCEEPNGDCSYDLDAIEHKVKSLMKSVEFNDVELKKEES